MAVKLIALDLDGTLLTSDKHISPATEAVLLECVERGIYIVPASGRMPSGLPVMLKNMPDLRYMIAANGATVEDLAESCTLVRCSIPWSDALTIIDMVKTRPIMYDAYIRGEGKIEERFLSSLERYVPEAETRRMVSTTRESLTDLRLYIEEGQNDLDKINLTFREAGERESMRKLLSEMKNILVTSSLPNNLELNASKATKGNGLCFLTKYLKLKKDETMAFGDAENDLSMLSQAGIGVAMGNALPAIIEKAKYVTASNDEDGVALAIEKLVLRP